MRIKMIPTTNFTTKVAKLLDHFVHVGKRVIVLSVTRQRRRKGKERE